MSRRRTPGKGEARRIHRRDQAIAANRLARATLDTFAMLRNAHGGESGALRALTRCTDEPGS